MPTSTARSLYSIPTSPDLHPRIGYTPVLGDPGLYYHHGGVGRGAADCVRLSGLEPGTNASGLVVELVDSRVTEEREWHIDAQSIKVS